MKRRILFVDDEPNVLDGLRRMLRAERARWDMRFAESADEALREMHETDVDAVVSDVYMPGMDGLALLQEIRDLLLLEPEERDQTHERIQGNQLRHAAEEKTS